MLVFSMFCWILKCAFSCNHLRTPVNEGKCYCPDCGRGLVYQWVILRCGNCQSRLEGRTMLRQVLPRQRCCSGCGEQAFHLERLENPSYFQLHKAQLMVQEEQDYILSRFGWHLSSMGEVISKTVSSTLAQLEPVRPSSQALAYLPVLMGR